MEYNKISAYIILYHDLQFLEDIINEIYDFVDEINIIDGPYDYNIKWLKEMNLFYDEQNKPEELSNLINNYKKIKYEYKIFQKEEEKRIFGYNKCSNNIVLLVDTDELFFINKKELNNFIQNKFKFVGGFEIYNMNRINVNFNKKAIKNIIFKKEKISAEDHLDYTWLINCKQKEQKIEYIDSNKIGLIYHQTLNRNKKNNIVKYIFYTCLFFHTNQMEINLFPNFTLIDLRQSLSTSDLQDIFYRSRLTGIGIPDENENNICVKNENVLINLEKYQFNHNEAYFKQESIGLKDIDSFFLLKPINHLNTELYIEFDNVYKIDISILNINFNEKYNCSDYTFVPDNNKIVIPYDFNNLNNVLDYVIKFNCKETINNNYIFKIKSIKII